MSGRINVLVCVKQVLNKEYRNSETCNIELCPADCCAVDMVLDLKEQIQADSTALSLGPQFAEKALSEAVALGIDKAVLITDEAFRGSDTLATAHILSCGVNQLGGFHLIVCGSHSVDGDTGQVGPELAEKLGISHVAFVTKIHSVSDSELEVSRITDEGEERVKVKFPVLITAADNRKNLRGKTIRGILKANQKKVTILSNTQLKIPLELCGSGGSATQVKESSAIQHKRNTKLILDKKEIKSILEELL